VFLPNVDYLGHLGEHGDGDSGDTEDFKHGSLCLFAEDASFRFPQGYESNTLTLSSAEEYRLEESASKQWVSTRDRSSRTVDDIPLPEYVPAGVTAASTSTRGR
jgi:hypothetical protein